LGLLRDEELATDGGEDEFRTVQATVVPKAGAGVM